MVTTLLLTFQSITCTFICIASQRVVSQTRNTQFIAYFAMPFIDLTDPVIIVITLQ